jgi:hypothetical protein
MKFGMLYLSTAIGLIPGGSSTVHIYTNNTQNNKINIKTTRITNETTQITTNVEECWPCLVFAIFTLAFALQPRKKHGTTSVRVAESIHITVFSILKKSVEKIKISLISGKNNSKLHVVVSR